MNKIINGYNIFNLYIYWYSNIMFNPRYKYVSIRLKKKIIVHKYLTSIGYKRRNND